MFFSKKFLCLSMFLLLPQVACAGLWNDVARWFTQGIAISEKQERYDVQWDKDIEQELNKPPYRNQLRQEVRYLDVTMPQRFPFLKRLYIFKVKAALQDNKVGHTTDTDVKIKNAVMPGDFIVAASLAAADYGVYKYFKTT